MSEININRKVTMENTINKEPILLSKNIQKLSLRKTNIQNKLKEKRNIIIDQNQNYYNINQEDELNIETFATSHQKIISNLTSNDHNLKIYSLLQLDNYFKFNPPNEEEQKILLSKNFFEILLNSKNEEDNDSTTIELILSIINNLLLFNEGSIKNFEQIYSEKYLKFYNDSFSLSDEIKNAIITLLIDILKINKQHENYIIIIILRSKIFKSIINYKLENKDSLDADVLINIFELISKCVNLSFYNEDQINEKDINIIKNIINIIVNEINHSKKELLIKYCFKSIHKISLLDNEYGLNEEIIKSGISLKIMKSKIKSKYLNHALKIIANNLTLPTKKCSDIYENNIISYYNEIFLNYNNNQKIIFSILSGILNISEGKFKEIVKESNIWDQNNLEKIFNMNDDTKIKMIGITKSVVLISGIDNLKFIYNTKILEYMIYLICVNDLSEVICVKMLKVIDKYLIKFKKEERNSEEFLCIFYKLEDLFKSTNKIIKINYKKNVVEFIINNITNKYDFN